MLSFLLPIAKLLSVKRYGSLTMYALQIDLVKALHTGTTPSIAASFGHLPLGDAPSSSIMEFQNKIFGQDDGAWPTDGQDSNLARLLIILNQHIVYSITLHPLGHRSTAVDTGWRTILSLNAEEETRRSHNTIVKALSRWYERYAQGSPPAVMALYHFTKLGVHFHGVHDLLSKARYSPTVQNSQNTIYCPTDRPSLEAVGSAWSALECASQTEDRNHLWLPVVTFLSALSIWKHIKSQGQSRAHGSVKVLQLFRAELGTMPWPCCKAMIETLDSLM